VKVVLLVKQTMVFAQIVILANHVTHVKIGTFVPVVIIVKFATRVIHATAVKIVWYVNYVWQT